MEEGDEITVGDSKICFLGNFPPKECGIATFTKDLVDSMNRRFNPVLKSRVIALNDDSEFYNYNNKVIMELNRNNAREYEQTAEKVNSSEDIKLVNVQHEFGIFGGDYGKKLLYFLEKITKPVVLTFHSVLPNPNKDRREIVRKLCSNSDAIIVMAKSAVDILNEDYNISRSKIHVIHHGIPNIPLYPNDSMKRKLKLEGRTLITTFGLLSKGKGIEYMIKSLPSLVEKYPNLLYMVIGETHPVIRKREGEKYRNKLVRLVKKLGLENNVKFYDKYLSLKEIIEYLSASDIYVCTNLGKDQIVSGTLSYAMGSGRAVISTQNIYAKEVLGQGRGILVKFRSPSAYTEALDRIISDDNLKYELGKQAYAYSRAMLWPNVAARHLNVFNKIVKLREETTKKYPAIDIRHIVNMTDDFGFIQFAKDTQPDKTSGYTLDDNARALTAMVMYNSMFKSKKSAELIDTYLKFLEMAQQDDGDFKNDFKNENEKLNEHSEDAFGRAMWALGYTVRKSRDDLVVQRANNLFLKSLNKLDGLDSIRAKAFSIIGLCNYQKKYPNDMILGCITKLSNYLVESYDRESSLKWQWYEKKLTYSNSKIPEALFLAYEVTKNEEYLEVGQKTLDFLSDLEFKDDELLPIGESGWYEKGKRRSLFDQQPINASAMVQALVTAYNVTGDDHYYEKAVLAFNWFLGRNYLKQMVYNESTGGCYDGLSQTNLNLNQGAESTISYLLARLCMEEIKRKKKFKSTLTLQNQT